MSPKDRKIMLEAGFRTQEAVTTPEATKQRSRVAVALSRIVISLGELGYSLGIENKNTVLDATPHPKLGRIDEDPSNVRLLDASEQIPHPEQENETKSRN